MFSSKFTAASAVTSEDIDMSRRRKAEEVTASPISGFHDEERLQARTNLIPHVPDYSGPTAAAAASEGWHRQLFGRGESRNQSLTSYNEALK